MSFDSLKINAYIDAYYETNRVHVAWSFWTSLVALLVGLAVLVAGVGLAFYGSGIAISVTTSAAGILTEFISAGFFYLYNKNLAQLNIFYRELIDSRDLLFAFGLIGHIPESSRPDAIKGLIGKILSRSGGSTVITPELVRAFAEAKAGEK